MTFDRLFIALLWLACLTLGGCGSRLPSDAQPVYPVRGTATFQGQPMRGAIVTFHAVNSRLTARGAADLSGAFTLTTYLADDGAPAGDYTVTIYWPADFSPHENDPDPPLAPDQLKLAYVDARTTTLRASVKPAPNSIDLRLP